MKATVKKIAIGITFASLLCGTIVANDIKVGDPGKNKIGVNTSVNNISVNKELPLQVEALSQVMNEKYNVRFDVNKTLSVNEINCAFEKIEKDELSAFEDSLASKAKIRFNVNDLISVKTEKGL